MCFSVMSRNRVQLFMLVFMLFHCSDFAEQPSGSTTSHDSFDFVHLLQTQRSDFSEQSSSCTALHSTSNLEAFLQTRRSEAPGSANISDARTQRRAEWRNHNAILYARRVSAQTPVHVHVQTSFLATETLRSLFYLLSIALLVGADHNSQLVFQRVSIANCVLCVIAIGLQLGKVKHSGSVFGLVVTHHSCQPACAQVAFCF